MSGTETRPSLFTRTLLRRLRETRRALESARAAGDDLWQQILSYQLDDLQGLALRHDIDPLAA